MCFTVLWCELLKASVVLLGSERKEARLWLSDQGRNSKLFLLPDDKECLRQIPLGLGCNLFECVGLVFLE